MPSLLDLGRKLGIIPVDYGTVGYKLRMQQERYSVACFWPVYKKKD